MKFKRYIGLLMSIVITTANINTVLGQTPKQNTEYTENANTFTDSTASGSGLEYDDALDIYSIYPYPLNLTFGAVKCADLPYELPLLKYKDIEIMLFDPLEYCPKVTHFTNYSSITSPAEVTPAIMSSLYYDWYHYSLAYGVNPSKYFDAKKYLEYNPDVREAYGDDYKKAYDHYITFGYKEGRNSGGLQFQDCVYQYGDLDDDGVITMCDAATLMQKVLKSDYIMPVEKNCVLFSYYNFTRNEAIREYADMDKDGVLTASDVAEIRQKVIKNNYKAPCELKTGS